jgi:chromosomal replication initiation ATPase DnaA
MDQFAVEYRRGPRGPNEPCGQRRGRKRTTPEARLFQAIEATFKVSHNDLCSATRGRCDVAFARQAGMYLARVALGMTLVDAGLLFGRDRTTAAHACRLVEDLRDDIQLDALLETIEAFVLRSDLQSGGGR